VDFVVPYGVLARSGVAEVIAVATREGAVTMRPALQIQQYKGSAWTTVKNIAVTV